MVGLPVPRTFGWLALAVVIWGFTLLSIGSALATLVRSRAELAVAPTWERCWSARSAAR